MAQDHALEDTAEALLAEWGRYQRRESSPGPAGYPRESTIYKAMRRRSVRRGRRKPVTGVQINAPPASPRSKREAFRRDWPEQVHAVDRVVALLPERQRKVAVVHYVQRPPMRVVAEIVGISRPSVYDDLARIRGELAARLDLTDAA
ncbi:hypothetical protein [Arhodomonas sp. SL1]|uniref:hypothetical protein n=1 Tax=Arhodomonas sp. SL1 TaxID=3425691 RepID=UPI003F881370